MPIRINLLAEQQAAEEARRKDPVKRAIIWGTILVVLTLLWAVRVHQRYRGAQAAYKALGDRYAELEKLATPVRKDEALTKDLRRTRISLERYARGRFLWGTFLQKVSEVAVEGVSLRELSVAQLYTVSPTNLLYGPTNIVVPYKPPPPSWKFWGAPRTGSLEVLVTNQFKDLTNKTEGDYRFRTNFVPFHPVLAWKETNTSKKPYTAKAEVNFIKATFCTEEITVTVDARDYSLNKKYEVFREQFLKNPYFASLGATNADPISLTVSGRVPFDPNDPTGRKDPFEAFRLQYYLRNRVLWNE